MAKTNFQIFNEENAPERTYNDSEYKEATQRVGGVMPGMALSRMHNKMYYQWSAMCKAIANLIVNHGHDCMDSDVDGITRYLEEAIVGAATTEITAHRTASELDHPEKSVHKKHLHQDAYESPALTGTPTAPTAGRGTNNGQIASTAFVAQAMIDTKNACVPKDAYRDAFLVRAGDGISDNISSILSGIALTKEDRSKPYPFNENGHLLVKVNGDRDILFVDETGAIRLFSTGSLFQVNTDAVFKKSPTAPTPPSGSNNTQLATTEFVALAKTGIVASNLAENGWVKFANGLILQWGIVKNGSGTQRVSFPISFSSKVFHINFSSTISTADAITNSAVQSYSLTGAELYGNTSPAGQILWFALGI